MSLATSRTARAGLTAAWTLVHRWKGRIFFAAADQGFNSATNFLLTILYAAWLPLADFGHFVVLWTVALFIENIQIASTTDALPGLTSRYGAAKRRRLENAGSWITLGYGVGTSIVLLAAVPLVAMWLTEPTPALLCLAAANPVQRLYLYMRRLSYLRDRSGAAAGGALAYCATMLGGAFSLHQFQFLSVANVVALWGVGALVAALVIRFCGVICLRPTRPALVIWLACNLWVSSRWLVGAAIGFWITQWGMFPLIAAAGRPDLAGILRALQNLFTPIIQFNAALSLAMLPRVAENVADRGRSYARVFALYGTAVFTGIVAVYCGLLLLEASRIVPLVYRKPEIVGAVYLLYPLALAIVLDAARQASAMTLLAQNRMKPAFVARLAAVVGFLAASLLLHPLIGIEAVLWANVLGHALATTMQMTTALAGDGRRTTPAQ